MAFIDLRNTIFHCKIAVKKSIRLHAGMIFGEIKKNS